MRKEKTNIKKKIGFILLGIVVSCWIAVPVLPFFDFPKKALVITIILVGGEVLFIITVALLGKTYWNKIKNGFFLLFSSSKKREERNKTSKATDKIDNSEIASSFNKEP